MRDRERPLAWKRAVEDVITPAAPIKKFCLLQLKQLLPSQDCKSMIICFWLYTAGFHPTYAKFQSRLYSVDYQIHLPTTNLKAQEIRTQIQMGGGENKASCPFPKKAQFCTTWQRQLWLTKLVPSKILKFSQKVSQMKGSDSANIAACIYVWSHAYSSVKTRSLKLLKILLFC